MSGSDPIADAVSESLAAAGVTPKPPEVTQDESITEAVNASVNEQRQDLYRVAGAAITKSPEEHAKLYRMGQQLGLPESTVDDARENAEQVSALKDLKLDQVATRMPALANWLLDQANMNAAYEDLKSNKLQQLWHAFTVGNAQRMWAEYGKDAMKRGIDPDTDPRIKMNEDYFNTPYGKEESGLLMRNVLGATEIVPGMAGGIIKGGAFSAVAAGATIAAGPEAWVATPVAASGGFALGVFMDTYDQEAGAAYIQIVREMKESGEPIDYAKAQLASSIIGSVNGLVEVVGFEAALKFLPGLGSLFGHGPSVLQQKTLTKTIVRSLLGYGSEVASESAQEGVQAAVTDLGSRLATGQPVSLESSASAFWGDFSNSVGPMAIVGLSGGGINLHDQLKQYTAGEKNAKRFRKYAEKIQQMKMTGVMPEKVGDLAAMATVAGHPENVYVDVEQFNTLFQSEDGNPRDAAKEIGIEQEYRHANANGGDIVIPFETYASRLANTPYHQSLINDLKLGPDDMTLRQREEFRKNLKSLQDTIEAINSGKEDESITKSEAYAIRKQQLLALEDPRIGEKEADHYAKLHAAFVSTMTERTGVDVMKEFPLVVTAEEEAAGATLNQPAQRDTPEFRSWFEGSKALDEAGNPRVLYHGTASMTPLDFSASREGTASTFLGPYKVERHGIFMAENPDLAAEFARSHSLTEAGFRDSSKAPSIMPVYVKASNPIDLSHEPTEALFNTMAEVAQRIIEQDNAKSRGRLSPVEAIKQARAEKDAGFNFARHVSRLTGESAWELFDADQSNPGLVVRVFKAMGFDSAVLYESNEDFANTKTWVAFDPEQVKSAIGNRGTYDPNDPNILHQANWTPIGGADFIEARNKSSRIRFLSPLTPEDVSNHILIVNSDRTVGFAVDPQGDIQNVFNNGGPKRAGAAAVVEAITVYGGRTLDCFDGYLPNLYGQLGFVETGRMSFNPQFAPDGWETDAALSHQPDIVFMAWQGFGPAGEAGALERAQGPREAWQPVSATERRYDDYGKAQEDARRAVGSGRRGEVSGEGLRGRERGSDLGAGPDLWGLVTQERKPDGSYEAIPAQLPNLVADSQAIEQQHAPLELASKQLRRESPLTGDAVVLFNRVAEDFEAKGYVDFTGRTVRSGSELAYMCRILRDPRWETFRIFYVKNDKVLQHEAVSARSPNAASAKATNESGPEMIERVNRTIEALGADGYWILHNHPSGTVKPSEPDIRLTRDMAREVPGMVGHVIIDHDEYTELSADTSDGSVTSKERVPLRRIKTGDKLLGPMLGNVDQQIVNPSQAAMLGKLIRDGVDGREAYVPISYVDAQQRVRLIEEIAVGLFNDPGAFQDHVRTRARKHGAVAALAYILDEKLFERAISHVEAGTLQDAVTPMARQSARMVTRSFNELLPEIDSIRLYQAHRGSISFTSGGKTFHINLGAKADLSTFLHESGHYFLEIFSQLAQREGSTVKADYEALIGWLGYKDHSDRVASMKEVASLSAQSTKRELTQDEIRTLSALTAREEKFALAFEDYLASGKAPSADLVRSFTRFARWLQSLYRSIRRLSVPIPEDIRRVMDRMIATDDQISLVEEHDKYIPMFANAKEAGMTEERFANYNNNAEEAHWEAYRNLDATLRAEQAREDRAWWQEEKVKTRAEVTKEVDAKPSVQAARFLRTGEPPEGISSDNPLLYPGGSPVRIGTRFIDEMYGPLSRVIKQKLGVGATSVDGAHPDGIAAMFGFKNGDEMIRAIISEEPRGRQITTETNRRMAEKHGSVKLDLEGAAREEVHDSGKRLKQLQDELDAMNRKAGKRVVKLSKALLSAYAEEQINSSKVRDIEPNRFLTAERRYATLASQLNAKGKFDEAVDAQKKRMINRYLYSAAVAAKEKAAKAARFINQQNGDGQRAKLGKLDTIDPRTGDVTHSYLQQQDKLLERFEFKPLSRVGAKARESIQAWIALEQSENRDPVIDPKLVDETYNKNWRDMTLNELNKLVDAVKTIKHQADKKNRILVGGKELLFDAVVNEAVAQARVNAPLGKLRNLVSETAGDLVDRTVIDPLRLFDSELVRMRELANELDADDANGIWHRILIHPLDDSAAHERELNRKVTKLIDDAIQKLSPEQRSRIGSRETIMIPSIQQTVTFSDLIAFALNTGNESNLFKMITGWQTERQGNIPWTMDTVKELRDQLTEEHWDFVQSLWDALESLWPEASALEKRLTGLDVKKVVAAPFEFTRPDGSKKSYGGGYYPIFYSPKFMGRTLQAPVGVGGTLYDAGAHERAITPHGHLIDRIETYARPVSLKLERMIGSVVSVVHDTTHREALINAWRFLSDQRVQDVLVQNMGEAYYRTMLERLRRVANARNQTSAFLNVVHKTQAAVAASYMGAKMSVILQNFANVVLAKQAVGSVALGRAMGQFAAHPVQTLGFIQGASKVMRDRTETRDNELRQRFERQISFKGGKVRRAKDATVLMGYKMMAYTNAFTEFPTWLAAYQNATKADPSLLHEEAVRIADDKVFSTFGGGEVKDLAAVQDTEAMKPFTMFYGFFSAVYNMTRANKRQAQRMWREGHQFKATAHVLEYLLWNIVVMNALSEVFSGRPPDDDDEENLLGWFAGKAASYTFAMVPFIRDIERMVERGKRDIEITPLGAPLQAGGHIIEELIAMGQRGIEGDDLEPMKVVKPIAELSAMLEGLPVAQGKITGGYIWDMWTGREAPETWAELVHNLLYSKRRHQR